MKNLHLGICCCAAWLAATPVCAQEDSMDEVRRLSARITGNQEQPKVLYIVPWKDAHRNAAVDYQPVVGQTDEAFRHIDRQEHVRELNFLQNLSQ